MTTLPQRLRGISCGSVGPNSPAAQATTSSLPHFERFPPDLVIPTESCEAHRLQQQMVEHLKSHQFCERDIFSIRLAVEEAMVNAMKHGNQLDRGKKVRFSYHVTDETFYVRVGDEGRGFDPTEVPDPTFVENLERPCGRGLLLMRHYMNAVHYLERGTICVMWKRRNGTAS